MRKTNRNLTIAALIGVQHVSLIETLSRNRDLSDAELTTLLTANHFDHELFRKADERRREFYGTDVYLRGLIELTNYCKNDCYYCGIRRSNTFLDRYRLPLDVVLNCCNTGYELGFRTFVLQGGEDPYYHDDRIVEIVSSIRKQYQDCAITLSLGEHSRESYQKFFDAGANRYLLRHETADAAHYAKLHPETLKLERRKECLWHLKEIGFQVGSGFMVGSPFQTMDCLIADLRFLQQLQPSMIGIGPFIAHRDTPFAHSPNGSFSLTLRLIAVLRLMFPYALIPATTALGTIDPNGREWGLRVGANVLMPNLSPVEVRKKYELYNNKICTNEEAAECRHCLERRVTAAGYNIVTDIGNVKLDSVSG
ncbi:MAG: [FeFe] hydrogenase H-cluster radical SAM maturase HydE [Planctomycetaceae bacterium]|nr:[FeFe] hydrogenase H-cluster radical SAM maturase HydE [Planctomycetaceae bacterium]